MEYKLVKSAVGSVILFWVAEGKQFHVVFDAGGPAKKDVPVVAFLLAFDHEVGSPDSAELFLKEHVFGVVGGAMEDIFVLGRGFSEE